MKLSKIWDYEKEGSGKFGVMLYRNAVDRIFDKPRPKIKTFRISDELQEVLDDYMKKGFVLGENRVKTESDLITISIIEFAKKNIEIQREIEFPTVNGLATEAEGS
jgi:hypothetical protein